jgi:hypothetical protein
MGLYHVSCSNSGLFYLGLNKIIYNMQKRRDILDYVFAPVYTDPYTKDGWKEIEQSVGLHGVSKLVPSGSTPSKPPRQGDGSFTPYTLDKSSSACTNMYNIGIEKDLFVEPDLMRVEYTAVWNQVEQMNHMIRWNSICEGYETIEELVRSTELLWDAINPLFGQNGSVSKSPAQLFFFGGSSCLGKYFGGGDTLSGPLWQYYEAYSQPSLDILGTLFNNSRDIWFLPIPTLNEVEVETSIYTVENSTTFIEIDDIGISELPEIIDLTGPTETLVEPDTSNYNLINVTPQPYPIITDPVTFKIRYTKIVLT